MSRLVAAPRRIEFVCLRTDPSPWVALHLASQRRSYLWLRSLWLPPTWTLTMLIWRLHGRTLSRESGNPVFSGFRLARWCELGRNDSASPFSEPDPPPGLTSGGLLRCY